MKLVKKSERPTTKTTVWVVEHLPSGDKRKQFSIYNTTLEEIEKILLQHFKEK
jgi:hypothetical protein